MGPAALAIRTRIKRVVSGAPDEVHVIYGHAGAQTYALSVVYSPSGGSGESLNAWLWKSTPAGYVFLRNVGQNEFFGQFGQGEFRNGSFVLNAVVPKPGDPECCPTGRRAFVVHVP
jgi:hypothetical protein